MKTPQSILLGLPGFALALSSLAFAQSPTSVVNKLGVEQDVRSGMKIIADDLLNGPTYLPELAPPVTGLDLVPQVQLRGTNSQVNFPSSDYIQVFTGFRPFVHSTQSEVSTAASGRNIVVGFNDSSGIHVSPNPSGPGLVVDSIQLSGVSVSHDSGQTWTRGFLPPSPQGKGTFGDPSLGVDRNGNFYYATLAANSAGANTIQVNSSKDGGATWSDGVIVQQDDGSDKEWLAVGPDPIRKNRDNIYVTWTSFQPSACELRFGRSTDAGVTWISKTIFVPAANPNPNYPQDCLQFSNPVVDQITGTLYVPFLRYSNADQDFIQMLVSKDAGETFTFATFNVPGAPEPTVLPVTQPGELTACGGGNIRLTIHGSLTAGPGRFGYPRYVNASRLVLQPSVAAVNGVVYLAWNNSRSLSFGSTAGSDIWFVRSDDGGQSWGVPVIVNPLVTTDTHHVLPSLAIDADPKSVHISYYTQHANSTVDLDVANSQDSGASFPISRTVRVTDASFNLPPTNIRLTNAPNYSATNYDRQIAVCYGLGEYQSATSANGTLYVGWGDARNLMTEPTNALSPISGQTHSQQDVFVQKVKAQ
ncbi:MAG TPA: sialidase family protein [Paludibaculum sp.]|jgi:hypothetical protein